MPGKHRVEIRFDDGTYAKLICPESGCRPAAFCPECCTTITESGCECCDAPPEGECWIKSWFDNVGADELLHGTLTVEIDAKFDGDRMIATVVDPSAASTPTDDSAHEDA